MSPFFKTARPPPAAASGEAFKIEGEPDRAGLAAIADARKRADAFFEQVIWRAHVHDFCRTGIAQGANATDEQDGVFIDVQFLVVDVGVVIFRTIKHDGLGFKGVRVFRVGEIAIAEFFRDHACFHDGCYQTNCRTAF